jgi:hypothetical protein
VIDIVPYISGSCPKLTGLITWILSDLFFSVIRLIFLPTDRSLNDKNILRKIIPKMNPPIWAHQAIPPCPAVDAALRNWKISQMPRKKTAGISTNWKKKKIGIKVNILKRPHISKEMKEPSVKEHKGYKGNNLLARGKIC